MSIEVNLSILVAALLIEALLGYPPALFGAIRHPVVWMGALLGWIETRLNRPTMPDAERRLNGLLALALLALPSIAVALALQIGGLRLLPLWLALPGLAIVASTLLAQRSLYDHVLAVANALDGSGVAGARAAVGRIVGRDTERLDQAGIARAAIESLAENFSDGVVAPAFWCALFGLAGMAAYKAINTADSMIGHRNQRCGAFGFAAAKLDDLVNLPASRLAALWLTLAALQRSRAAAEAAIEMTLRDARQHRSPNAGWPEAAMAGALGLRLGGPRLYDGAPVDDSWMGNGRAEANSEDIRDALKLYRTACAIQIAAYLLLLLLIVLG